MNFLATGSYDGEIKLWNIETERFYYTICKPKEYIFFMYNQKIKPSFIDIFE